MFLDDETFSTPPLKELNFSNAELNTFWLSYVLTCAIYFAKTAMMVFTIFSRSGWENEKAALSDGFIVHLDSIRHAIVVAVASVGSRETQFSPLSATCESTSCVEKVSGS